MARHCVHFLIVYFLTWDWLSYLSGHSYVFSFPQPLVPVCSGQAWNLQGGCNGPQHRTASMRTAHTSKSDD